MTLPVVSVISAAAFNALLRMTSRAAHIAMLPPVTSIPARLLFGVTRVFAVLTMLTSRPALNSRLPFTIVIGALTLISCPQHTTKLPRVGVMAALMFTFPAAFNVKVESPVVFVQVSAEATVISPAPVPGAPALVVVMVTLVPPPASNALLKAPTSTVAVFTPEFGV